VIAFGTDATLSCFLKQNWPLPVICQQFTRQPIFILT
jgi:hypothetical protein